MATQYCLDVSTRNYFRLFASITGSHQGQKYPHKLFVCTLLPSHNNETLFFHEGQEGLNGELDFAF